MKHMYMCTHKWFWTFVWILTCLYSPQILKLVYLDTNYVFSGVVETLSCYWSDPIIFGDAMVLGKLPVPGRPTILITVGQEPIALAVG